jgi:5-hydroxyisourate hydrolase-like protein (transthyretin family)
MKQKILKVSVFVVGSLMIFPLATQALSGIHADDTRVKLYSEQGDDWFRALTERTDSDGVLELKNVLPGWYEARINDDDETSGQTVAIKARMLDLDGRRLKEETNVDLFHETATGVKTPMGTVETDEDGWLKVSPLSADVKYKFELSDNDDSSIGHKDGKTRIKCKAKIDDSNWFSSYYGRTDENQVLEVINVLPGKYKFKYKSGDRDVALPFILNATVLSEKGEEIKEVTKVHLWAYLGPEKVKTFAGEVMTNDDGEITVPGLMPGVKYKIEVKD